MDKLPARERFTTSVAWDIALSALRAMYAIFL